MRFAEIYARAVARKGSESALEASLPTPKTPDELAAVSDDRYLSWMTRQVFRAGFVWKVIDNKWDGFEEGFLGFEPRRIVALNDEEIEALASDTRIVRHYKKVLAAQKNARFVLDVAAEHGSFGRYLADWPDDAVVALWDELKRRAARLGGSSGPYFLRMVGKDTFLFSQDVVRALVGEGVVDKAPTAKKDIQAAAAAFNAWREVTGRPLCQLSRILALSVG